MSYEHCEVHNMDATNGCAECETLAIMEEAAQALAEERLEQNHQTLRAYFAGAIAEVLVRERRDAFLKAKTRMLDRL